MKQKPLSEAQMLDILKGLNETIMSGEPQPATEHLIYIRGVNTEKEESKTEKGDTHYGPKFIQKSKKDADSDLPRGKFIDIEVVELVNKNSDTFDGSDKPVQLTVFENELPLFFEFLKQAIMNKKNSDGKYIPCSGDYVLIHPGNPAKEDKNTPLVPDDRPKALLSRKSNGKIINLVTPTRNLLKADGTLLTGERTDIWSGKKEKNVKATDNKITFFATPTMCENLIPVCLKQFSRVARHMVTPIEPDPKFGEVEVKETKKEEADEKNVA